MRPSPLARWLLLALLGAQLASACGRADECEVCTTDSDCKPGFVCSSFLDGTGTTVTKRCGSGVGTTTCRVR